MNFLKKLFRPQIDVDAAFIEAHELIIRAARRCAYDLRHAAEQIYWCSGRNESAKEESDMYFARADMWISLFNAGHPGKDYRHKLHQEIFFLECEVNRLQKLLADNGIPYHKDTDIPF